MTPEDDEGVLEILRKNDQCFINTLQTAISGLDPKWVDDHKDKPIQIVSVGIGAGAEIGPLFKEFPNATLIGIDKSQESIETTGVVTRIKGIPNYQHRKGDASDPLIFEGINASLVIIRSPDAVSEQRAQVWKRIIANTWGHISKGGVLYITANETTDIEFITQILKECKIKFTQFENPEPMKAPTPFPENVVFAALKSEVEEE